MRTSAVPRAVQRLLHKLVIDLVREDVKATMMAKEMMAKEKNAVSAEALVQFIAGALFGLLMWSMDGKMRLSVAEVNALFRRLAIPGLRAARA